MAQTIKNLPAMQETQVQSLGWEDSTRDRNGNPLQYSCLENPMGKKRKKKKRKSHGQRSLAGYSPQGCSQTQLERLSIHAHKHAHTHKGM